jgi:hypothetical protein
MKNDINQLIDALVLEERNTGFNPYISTRIMVAVENEHNKIVFPFSPFWKTAVVGLSMIAAVFTGMAAGNLYRSKNVSGDVVLMNDNRMENFGFYNELGNEIKMK